MKKLFTSLFLFWTIFVHAGYNYHWALEQKFTTRSSINQIKNVNNLIGSLKRDGNWTLLDAFWVMAMGTQQQAVYNWKSPGTFTLTEVNSPSWVTNQGYTGDGATSYLNSNFNPATQGVNYVQNNASFFVYSRTDADNGLVSLGFRAASSGSVVFLKYLGNLNGRINTGTNAVISNANTLGLHLIQRTASNASEFFKSGTSIGTSSIASLAVESFNAYILAYNANGTASLFDIRQIAVAGLGASFTTGQNSSLSLAIETYMDALGTGVQ